MLNWSIWPTSRVSAGCAWRPPLFRVHALFEVGPALLGDLDLVARELPRVLAEHLQENDEISRAPVQDPVELASVVTAKFSQLTLYLRGVRERQVRIGPREHVETVDLEVDRCLPIRIAERLDELVDRLGPVGGPV